MSMGQSSSGIRGRIRPSDIQAPVTEAEALAAMGVCNATIDDIEACMASGDDGAARRLSWWRKRLSELALNLEQIRAGRSPADEAAQRVISDLERQNDDLRTRVRRQAEELHRKDATIMAYRRRLGDAP